MNRTKWLILFVALGLMGGTAGVLQRIKTHHQLGAPGLLVNAIPGSPRLEIPLPATVLDYRSENVSPDDQTIRTLPADTSFAQRRYRAADGFTTVLNVVLMGTDRTSIHKPEICLTAQGCTIKEAESEQIMIPMERPHPYDLPVMKLISSRVVKGEGQPVEQRGVYLYWFVADHEVTASHLTRSLHIASGLLRTGVLQRWAYVTCFAECAPGQETATCERMKKFIAEAVPQFQLATGSQRGNLIAQTR